MSRPIEQALLSLLPSHNSNLPAPLVELASSLLAQSRNKASTLKAEEEVARAYACANLACDRLKITLNLPPIEPRPPVPPRIYKRLYTHLDKILPAASLAGRPKANALGGTPRSNRLASGAAAPSSPLTPSRGTPRGSARGTPTKEVSLSHFRTPRLASRSATARQAASYSSLPPWILPTVRHLCARFQGAEDGNHGPSLASSVMAGLDTIIAPYGERTKDEWVNSHLLALLGAIYWLVSESAALAPGEELRAETSRARYKSMRKEILTTLRAARDEISVPASVSMTTTETAEQDAAFWEGWQSALKAAELDDAITQVASRGWLDSDWYRSIDFLRDKAGDANGDADADDLGEDMASAAASVQITKADSMLQDKFDYLSERRRASYRQWKTDILRRIEKMERTKNAAVEV
ncbi:origin recognition complex, subunit 6 [Coniella lustricola]|uniref:Origin recognition complex, subunit 6 n=1 Tax=Coniella lustricola TaxID=2025994 RepID=A0A2T3A3R1_9PEZI|nr:origin recognition complex, subunit 6 [Coniella lustricola]